MQYPTTADSGNLYPTPPPTPGFPVATNYGDYIFYNGADWTVGDTKIKLGGYAGQANQGNNAVALGYFAGNTNQGQNSVAIGYNAGIVGQEPNTIILNATGNFVVGVGGQQNSFYVDPVRDYTTNGLFKPMGYNPATHEIGYTSTPLCGIHQCVAGTTQVITITGLTTGGVVGLTYIHPPGGGAGQYFESSTPTTNTLTIVLGVVATTAESIIWNVGKL